MERLVLLVPVVLQEMRVFRARGGPRGLQVTPGPKATPDPPAPSVR